MASGYDLVIVGWVPPAWSRRSSRRTRAVAWRPSTRTGSAAIASGPAVSLEGAARGGQGGAHMRHRRRLRDPLGRSGGGPAAVWRRVRSVRDQIATTDDSPSRFRGHGRRPPRRVGPPDLRDHGAGRRAHPRDRGSCCCARAAGRRSRRSRAGRGGLPHQREPVRARAPAGPASSASVAGRSPSRWRRRSPGWASRRPCSRRVHGCCRATSPSWSTSSSGSCVPRASSCASTSTRIASTARRPQGGGRARRREGAGVGSRRAPRGRWTGRERRWARARRRRHRDRAARHRGRRPGSERGALGVRVRRRGRPVPVHPFSCVRRRARGTRHVLSRQGQGDRGRPLVHVHGSRARGRRDDRSRGARSAR